MMNPAVSQTRDLARIALFAAIIAALGLIPAIPLPFLPVPITAQTLGVMLAGAILGSRRGGAAVLIFLLLVAIGLPLLPGGRGGFGVFFGPTAGFLLSWPLGAFVIGLLMERFRERVNLFTATLFNLAGGVAVIYAGGIAWLAFVAGVPFMGALTGSAAFIPGDLIKAVVAASVALTVHRAYPGLVRRPG